MYIYKAFGLVIQSELLLPELVITEGAPDLVIRLGKVDGLAPTSVISSYIARTALGTIWLHDGHELVIDPAPKVEEPILRNFILGPVLAALLRQRGLLAFHASSIAINGSAIAFLGRAGWGKSTLVEAFYTQGYSIVTDDLLAIQISTSRPVVFPSFPQVKLWPDVATSLGYIIENLPRMHSYSEKRVHCVNDGFSQTALPLKRIYVLAEDRHPKIEVLNLRDALIELIKHSHGVTLLKIPDLAESNFSQCTALVKHVPICRLKRPRSLSQLSNSVKLVEHHFAQTIC
jgi:hypothetical protein